MVRDNLRLCDCGAEFFFAVSSKGNRMPLRWPPTTYAELPTADSMQKVTRGRFVLVTQEQLVDGGEPMYLALGLASISSVPDWTQVYESHFADCPNAIAHRRVG